MIVINILWANYTDNHLINRHSLAAFHHLYHNSSVIVKIYRVFYLFNTIINVWNNIHDDVITLLIKTNSLFSLVNLIAPVAALNPNVVIIMSKGQLLLFAFVCASFMWHSARSNPARVMGYNSLSRDGKIPRTIRAPFKNNQMMTARGFGKRSQGVAAVKYKESECAEANI